MDFRKNYNHLFLYPQNKMAFEMPFTPRIGKNEVEKFGLKFERKTKVGK